MAGPANTNAAHEPLLLRAFVRLPAGVNAAPPPLDPVLVSRIRVQTHLLTKHMELDDTCTALREAMRESRNDPAHYDDLATQLSETKAEQSLCKARYDAIQADQPFHDPGIAEENRLLAAIAVVDEARANTSAFAALINAADGLIAAYSADSTK